MSPFKLPRLHRIARAVRSLLALLASTLLIPSAAQAQLSVGLELSQDQFLPGESIPVSVRITNFSGQTLEFGQDNQWLRFGLEMKSGLPLAPISDPPVAGQFALENATIAKKWVDLGPHYDPLQPGRYLLRAYVRVPAWSQNLTTPPVEFDIIQGTVLWEQAFGIPSPSGATTLPEVRRYGLQQAIHLKQMKLYARVTDGDGRRVLKVFPLGPMLTFSEPEHQLDRLSRLHVLYQYGARSFYYYIIGPEGEILLRQTYDYAGASRPKLGTNLDNQIVVVGGVRRPTLDDLPRTASSTPAAAPTAEIPITQETEVPPAENP